MIDKEYLSEIATEIGALLVERDAITQRIDEWFQGADENGIERDELDDEIARQRETEAKP